MEVGEHDTLVGGGTKRPSFLHRFKFPIIAFVIVVVAAGIVLAVLYSAQLKENNKAWEDLVQVGNLMSHLQELQNIADANNNTRAAATSGYAASVNYIVEQLRKHTDYNVTVQPFTFESVQVGSVSNLTITLDAATYTLVYQTDFAFMGAFQGVYNIDASVTQALGYGCGISDFDDVLPNTIALIKRGNCTFAEKVALAETKTPVAVVIYNEGNSPDRLGLFSGGLGPVNVPVIATNYYAGVSMQASRITLTLESTIVVHSTMNVLADTKVGRADRVIVVGSHLDSVPAGPGINDNGSGSSLNIELAIQLADDARQKKIKNKIRFAWFGAEELGLLGSVFYVSNLNATDKAELANIAVNLNFDMIGSPNFIRGVYDGASDKNSNGSAVVQNLFNKYYASHNIAVTPTDFSGRSDYGPFLAAQIPAGGLFTGAEEEKTMAWRTTFGGLAGASLDPCYHQACDTIDNIDQGVLSDMGKGGAHVLETLATQDDLRLFLNTL